MRSFLVALVAALSVACAHVSPELAAGQKPAKKSALKPIAITRIDPRVVVSAPIEVLTIYISIPRDADNRQWCLAIDGPAFYSSACQSLAGANEPAAFHTAVLHLTNDGEYQVIAELHRAGLSRPLVARDKVFVGVQRADIGNDN
jgi:hypothetical protein